MMKIHTVAAGGGSILHLTARAFASARLPPVPIPAPLYRRGGPLAVTDANLWSVSSARLLSQDLRPRGTSRSTRRACASFRGAGARNRRRAEPGRGRGRLLAIAVAKMAEAIKKISVARGYDVTRYALNCFGGAGGQHACDVADALAIKTVLIHPFSSLLSAYGLRLAHIAPTAASGSTSRCSATRARSRRLASPISSPSGGRRGQEPGRRARGDQAPSPCAMRYAGSDTGIEVKLSRPAAMRRAFEGAHKSRFWFIDHAKAIAIEAVSVEAVRGRGAPRRTVAGARLQPRRPPLPARRVSSLTAPGARRTSICARRCRSAPASMDLRSSSSPASDDRRRAGLGRRGHGEEPRSPDRRRADAAARGVARRQGLSGRRSRSSTISSCRSPSRWA